jgi:hypothetical protein
VVDDPNDADDEVPTASFAIGWFPARTHVNWYRPVAVNFKSPVVVENAETVPAP